MASKNPDLRLRCPKDGALMEKMPAGDLIVDHCARCGSTWFDPYELEVVLKTKGAAEQIDYGKANEYNWTVYRPSSILCPRDNHELISVPDARQPHIVIDVCKKCGGVLLDAGELRDLNEFTLAERFRAFIQR